MQKESTRGIIYERIHILLSLAQQALRAGDEKHAKRYVFLARKLSTRYNCRMGVKEKSMFCRGCGMVWIHGKNVRVRLKKRTRRAEYLCSCGRASLFKY